MRLLLPLSSICALASALVVAPSLLQAQENARQTTELIGLHSWTRQMIKDSLAKHVPGSDTTLNTHACGAEIMELGFVRTAAIYYPTRTLVSVVEPADSARVRLNPPILTAPPLPEDWEVALKGLHQSESGKLENEIIPMGIKLYPLIRAGKADSVRAAMRAGGTLIVPELDLIWAFMSAHTTDIGRNQALQILTHDSIYAHRVLAVAVLANFPTHDEAWRALLHTLRERNDVLGVWITAKAVLDRWASSSPRRVDWSKDTSDLRAFLAGANLWALPNVLKILTATKIDPNVAHSALAGNDVFVLGYASSGDPNAAAVGINFLTQASGHTYGADIARWRAWTQSL